MDRETSNNLGATGEEIVRLWLAKKGYYVLPSSLIKDHGAPMLIAAHIKTILPDNLTWKDGCPGWVEVKTKSHASLHISPPYRYEHGFPLHQWRNYQLVQQITGITVSVAVLELDTRLLLLARLAELDVFHRVGQIQGLPHIFFDRNAFSFTTLPNMDLPTPVEACAPRTQQQDRPPIIRQPGLPNEGGM